MYTCQSQFSNLPLLPFVVVIQLLSHVQLSATPWAAACQASLSFLISWSCTDSCPLSWWCHPTISSSVTPFSSCPQCFPASRSFPMSRLLFTSGGHSIGASISALILPLNIQDWFPLGLTGLISFSLTPHNYKFIFYICHSVSVL